MDRKINLFIGGSQEGIKYAATVKDCFERTQRFVCTIWNKDSFQYNESFLFSITKASLIHDFGIFIASKDDIALIRNEIENIPRDNVLFEYGLFLGAMGNNRTFLIQEKECKLPTDLLGYTTPRFENSFSSTEWQDLINDIADNITIQFDKSEIQLLPSTSLAIGYFNSFIYNVTRFIFENDGCYLNKENSHHKDVTFKVILPDELSDDISAKAHLYYKSGDFLLDEIGNTKRPFPIRYFKNETENRLLIVDVPTTLNAIRPAINLLIPDSALGNNPEKLRLERKELENFKKTLEFLISQDDYTNEILKVEWME